MGHNKVYGHCENFCNVEVVAKENFALITGSGTMEASVDYNFTIDYPTGFTKDNCVVMAFGVKVIEAKGFEFSGNYVDSGDILRNSYKRTISLANDNIEGTIRNPNSSSKEVSYKIVLLKLT